MPEKNIYSPPSEVKNKRAEEEYIREVREYIKSLGHPDPGPNFENNPPFVIKLNKGREKG